MCAPSTPAPGPAATSSPVTPSRSNLGRRTEKYRLVRANAKTLTCRNTFAIDDTKQTYDRVLSRTWGGVTTTDPGTVLPPGPTPSAGNTPRRSAR